MTDLPFSGWLALREPADAEARATDLVDLVRDLVHGTPLVIHDLGCGTGSMARWLAPKLPGPQHWIMYDRDPRLLASARSSAPTRAADGTPVTVETRCRDITRLTPADLGDAALITASALLDMLTGAESDRIVAACAAAGRPTLLSLSVVGRVRLAPADPLDEQVAAAFNEHQRRVVGGQRLLGPDAVADVVAGFARRNVATEVRSSPWRLGPQHGDLIGQWFTGWLSAAREQRPELVSATRRYARTRADQVSQGLLRAVVEHEDVLAC